MAARALANPGVAAPVTVHGVELQGAIARVFSNVGTLFRLSRRVMVLGPAPCGRERRRTGTAAHHVSASL
ncbi:hypothetical protein ACFUCV_06630 [Specibacter sp. NPDC057265]|uniref:hypothetical protein n=1 Tax=Specibacter sp. NPDC057265 TaxID=3346075 RepID=UPI0036277406